MTAREIKIRMLDLKRTFRVKTYEGQPARREIPWEEFMLLVERDMPLLFRRWEKQDVIDGVLRV